MRTVTQRKNIAGFRIWMLHLGYNILPLKGQGFIAKAIDPQLKRQIKRKHHYILVTDLFSGNMAAFELGKEFEEHLKA
ncbi:response regulator [Acinetobacter pollinis]|uniref:Response regulator n=1 Tax=Acinetobacter pollinis TaxID=2605270 RepID=A0ABU6DW25_9GAMM|nr:response regulator [Acinetobacter pollinis]MEB5477608.1 response regulator [Acinetobacter pollinis]